MAEEHRLGLVFVNQADLGQLEPYFAKKAPGLPVISDPEAVIYEGFGLKRGSLWQLLGPKAVLRAFAAMARGHFVGTPSRDPRRMPGVFLVQGQEIHYAHRARHTGDLPDREALAAGLAGSGQKT